MSGLDNKKIDELNRISTINYLRYVDGKISRMKPGQRLIMEEFGILKRKPLESNKNFKQGRYNPGVHFMFTEKGKKLLEELNE